MSFRICLILFLYFVCIGQCAVFFEVVKQRDEQPDVCVSANLPSPHSLEVGSSLKHPTECLQFTCSKGRNANELIIQSTTCGKSLPPDGCRLEYPIKDRYPECCRTNIVCD
ncbi:hypothetical protein O3M35_009029 [Rhynocoris fuscipes]|uniref:Single domain-containing protein n=1 Tax=Rhynocoris fuscipes TaxID=488301 RepID=A0AAW1D2C8_9HEMI